MWDNSVWRQINTGWMWDNNSWRQFFSSGTFQPEIRSAGGDVISTRAVGNLLYGYRGSNVSATYTYTWQYGVGNNYFNNWLTQTGTGATGTLTGGTLTTTYQTTATDVTRLETLANNYILWMRFRVVKSGETQLSNNVRIHKKVASQLTQSTVGFRAFDSYSTTFNWSTRNPYSNDIVVFWSATDWNNTVDITNDRRPDYYIFTYTVNGEVTVKDSRLLDTDFKIPTNASRFQVPASSSYLGMPVYYEIEAHTSSPSSPTIVSGQTRNISDGNLTPATNLDLAYNVPLYPGKLFMSWDASDGGNNNTIFYDWYLLKDNVYLADGTVTGGVGTDYFAVYPSSGVLSEAGDYRFFVQTRQTGSTAPFSDFSNTVTVTAPLSFTYTISNRTTTDGIPGDFTIFSFAQNTTISNRIELDWSDSTNANEYESAWYRPDGTSSSNPVTTSSDYWGYAESGTYTSIITARNEQTQFVRFSWTKPAGTSANSYRIVYRQTTFGSSFNTTVDVGDVTNYDLTFSNQYTTNVQIISITAYSSTTAGTGISRVGLAGGSITLTQSQLQEVATRQKQRSEFLTYILASVGTLQVTGNAEPGESLNYIYSGTWSPSISDPGWTFTRTWGITRTAVGLPDTYTRGTAASVTPLVGDIGENLIIRVVATWKDQTPSFNTVRAYSEIVVPAPPAFTLTNNFNQTFTISNVSSSGGGFYFGTYTGGSVSETNISSSFTSPVLSLGSKSVTLFGRAKKSIEGFTEIFDGRRSTTNSVNVTDLGDFTWSMNDQTSAPSQPGTIAVTFTDSRVDLNWPDVAGAERYFSQIFSSAGASANSNYRSVSDDYWPVTNGGFSVSGDVTSVNQNGVVRVTGLNSAGAQSYRVTYRIGATTYISDTTASSVDISLPSLVDQFGTTFEVLSVRAYRNIDWTGAQKIGSYSGGGTTGSITVFQAQSAPKAWSGTTASQPGIPAGFGGSSAAGSTTVNLQWFPDVNSTSYGIVRSTSSTFSPTSTTSPNITTPGNVSGSFRTFDDTGRAQGTTYYYWIRGQNSLLNSTYSSRISVTVPAATAPLTPNGVNWSYSGFSGGSYRWSGGWSAVTGAASYDYQIQYATDNAGTNTNTVSGNTASTSLTGSNATKPWSRMRVRSVGPTGLTSPYSLYTAWV
jgi:hypothetical protein